jgi:hypothetical protein
VPRWIERRGFTLQTPQGSEGSVAQAGEEEAHFVRLSLMERVGFVSGWFNVREARAEPDPRADTMKVAAGGRALSWRWLRQPEAERLLDERLGTLEAMGYTLIDSQMATRGRWDWLYELVHRRLAARAEEPEGDESESSPTDALRDALSRLGLSPDAVVEGVASVLGLTPHALEHPEARTVRRTDPDQLSVLLPFLVHHEHAHIREIGERWLTCPPVAYQLPPKSLLRWLETDARIGDLLGPRLDAEGLAMLGPDALLRLSRTGHGPVKSAAKAWSHRLLG